MKNKTYFRMQAILAIIVMFGLAGCDIDSSGLQPSTGKTNEMLVVTDGEDIWNSDVGLAIKQQFGRYMEGLPQDEQTYDIAHIPEKNFSKLFKTHHNIFIVDIDPSFEKPLLEFRKDLWAEPQRVIKMTVADKETFFREFKKNRETFIELFNANERRRARNAYASIEDYKITKHLEKKYDVDILIPKSFFIATEKENFVWLRREAGHFSQGIMMYFYPYTDTIAFNYDRIISIRDSITKKYVPGPSKGSYMKVSMIEPPFSRRIDFKGRFAVEMRGLWELENDFMGGPFVSYTMVDTTKNRVVTIDGYVYNPRDEKKNLVRQIEALLYTFEIPEPKENTNPES